MVGIRKKRNNEGINRRKDTLVKKAYELGEFDGVDAALIICKHGWYTTYRSRDYNPLPKAIVPEDVEKRLFKQRKRKLAEDGERGSKSHQLDRQTTCE